MNNDPVTSPIFQTIKHYLNQLFGANTKKVEQFSVSLTIIIKTFTKLNSRNKNSIKYEHILDTVKMLFMLISERLLWLSTSSRDNVLILFSGQKVFGDSFALF